MGAPIIPTNPGAAVKSSVQNDNTTVRYPAAVGSYETFGLTFNPSLPAGDYMVIASLVCTPTGGTNSFTLDNDTGKFTIP